LMSLFDVTMLSFNSTMQREDPIHRHISLQFMNVL